MVDQRAGSPIEKSELMSAANNHMQRAQLDVVKFAQSFATDRSLYVFYDLDELTRQNVPQERFLVARRQEHRVHKAEGLRDFWCRDNSPGLKAALRVRYVTVNDERKLLLHGVRRRRAVVVLRREPPDLLALTEAVEDQKTIAILAMSVLADIRLRSIFISLGANNMR